MLIEYQSIRPTIGTSWSCGGHHTGCLLDLVAWQAAVLLLTGCCTVVLMTLSMGVLVLTDAFLKVDGLCFADVN